MGVSRLDQGTNTKLEYPLSFPVQNSVAQPPTLTQAHATRLNQERVTVPSLRGCAEDLCSQALHGVHLLAGHLPQNCGFGHPGNRTVEILPRTKKFENIPQSPPLNIKYHGIWKFRERTLRGEPIAVLQMP